MAPSLAELENALALALNTAAMALRDCASRDTSSVLSASDLVKRSCVGKESHLIYFARLYVSALFLAFILLFLCTTN